MIGFEVLHYETINETIQCVESILSNVINPVIVVVDNASSNNSGNELIEKFKSYDNVFVLINEKNLGFAKGNNIGYKFCEKNLI
ncbi:glycosyltransferase [Enterococcus faecium]|uniref:glycosyltransferase n=1 Tax=Enterococcus faecium TaxID=1352 RepID=UPI0024B8CE03|nr:glycosyltransferase [Enterococcus faecium]UXD44446.1 glycosyltransferase [Enterococcus faecium]